MRLGPCIMRYDPSVITNRHFAECVDALTFRYRGELKGVNTDALVGFVKGPTLSPYKRSVYYHKRENTRFDIYRASKWNGSPCLS